MLFAAVACTDSDPPAASTPTATPVSAERARAEAVIQAHRTEKAAGIATVAPLVNSALTSIAGTDTSERLALLAGACTFDTDIGYQTCEGSVRNLSSQSLANVLVVIELTTADGVTQSSADALIDYTPLLPGQDSPWKVIARYNPALTNFRIVFTDFSGARINHRDDRP